MNEGGGFRSPLQARSAPARAARGLPAATALDEDGSGAGDDEPWTLGPPKMPLRSTPKARIPVSGGQPVAVYPCTLTE